MLLPSELDRHILRAKITRGFELAEAKITSIHQGWDANQGTPVFTVNGSYTSRGWTEWTQGFQFGCPLLVFEATDNVEMLELGRSQTMAFMAPHLTHFGVHDHGFNNISTYGNLRRLARVGRFEAVAQELQLYDLALKISGAVQAKRWTTIRDQAGHRTRGFVHSFNGPHSLFSDTIRSMRSLVMAWQLGHRLMDENDESVCLLERSIEHCLMTAEFNVYYGDRRDIFDIPKEAGRVAHESIFNITDGRYRCPSTQQGYSAFTTWTRGLAWILCGFAEQLELLKDIDPAAMPSHDKNQILDIYLKAAQATAQWYISHSFHDGMVYWDSGAPNIPADFGYDRVSNPFEEPEPIDSSAAAIAAQGFLRLSRYLRHNSELEQAARYWSAAETITHTIFDKPYLSMSNGHQGLLLHSIYHQPNGWDHTPSGRGIPCGESCMWGDYHALELGTMMLQELDVK